MKIKMKMNKWVLTIICGIIIVFFAFINSQKLNEGMKNENQHHNITYIVIHMKGNRERYENVLLNETKLKQKINIFDAIDGKKINLNDLTNYAPNLKNNFIPNKYTPNFNIYAGVIGCYLSHLMVIKNIDTNTGYTVIFEDDLKILDDDLHKNINTILDNMTDDFDLIFLGNLNNNHKDNYKDNIYYIDPNNHLYGNQAYIVNNKNAKKIYNLIFNIDDAIDAKYKELIDKKLLNGFVIYPILVEQKSENKEMNSLIR